jgi:hypothetical protein
MNSAVRLIDAALAGRGGYIVNLVEVYFDESGSHQGSPVLCVAGYLLDSENAKLLTKEWDEVLGSKGLTHFRMVDCAHGNGEFAKLSKDDRIEVAKALIEIIKARMLRGMGAMIVAERYDELMPYHPNLGGSYSYCIWNCLIGIGEWRKEANYQGDMAFFFESGHASQSEANRTMDLAFRSPESRAKLGYVSHTFVDKKKFPAVQAADLLAWQMFTDWKHGMTKKPRRKDFAYLIDGKNHRALVLDAEKILKHASEMTAMDAWGNGGSSSEQPS